MKYIIFGTGKYCETLIKYINENDIMYYMDNNLNKQGRIFRGKKIYTIERALQESYDSIIVMIKNYGKPMEQLASMGVPQNRIIPYDKLWMIDDIPQHMVAQRGEKTIMEWAANRKGRKVFVCCHLLSRSGVPVASMNLSILLKKMNYQVLMGALIGGALEQDLADNNIDYISDLAPQGLNENMVFMNQFKLFDVIILGTFMLARVGDGFAKIGVPIIWWMHESIASLWKRYSLPENRSNFHYYGGGKRVLKQFNECYPEEDIEELLYYLPDTQSERSGYKKRRTFAVIAYFDERKAQDIMMRAIMELPAEIRDGCDFYFIGRADGGYRVQIDEFCKRYGNVSHIYELSQKELAFFYQRIDILVCPSRDDPMPIVVTQAMQNGIPCLVSDQVGQSIYIKEMGGGCVFQSENVTELKECLIKAAFWEREEWEEYSRQARGIFDSLFSEEIMRRNIQRIMGEILGSDNL